MGAVSRSGSLDESPRHEVTLTPFCIDRTEVTVAAYRACVGHGCTTPSAFHDAQGDPDAGVDEDVACNWEAPGRELHPINCVEWSQATAYCAFRGAALPTEAQWEFAARGASGRAFPWGDEVPTPSHANLCGAECASYATEHGLSAWRAIGGWRDPFATTAPVGSFRAGATPEGVLDMAGNVEEWTGSYYTPYPGASGWAAAPGARAWRGGSFCTYLPQTVRGAARGWSLLQDRHYDLGFRCATRPS